MHPISRRTWLAALAAAPLAATAQVGHAPVRIRVGAPAGGTTDTMARALARRLGDAARQAVATPEVRKRIEFEGATPVGNAPAEFAAFVHEEIGRWAKVVKYSGAKPE